MKSASRPSVIVIGSGFAGLRAAWALGQRGIAVTVLERAQRPGGRTRSETVEGFTLEAAGSLVSTGDRELLAWIDAIGIRDELLPLRPVVTMHAVNRRLVRVDPRGPIGVARMPGVHYVEALRLVRLPRLMARYGARIDPETPELGADLDDRSLGDFARLYFGRSVLAHWMGPFVAATSLGHVDHLSRVLFLRRLQSHAQARPGLLRAGIGEIAEAAASKLPVVYGADVQSIGRVAGGGLSVHLHGLQVQRKFTADAVIVATGAADAARITSPVLAPAERDGLAAVRCQPAISLALGLRRPFCSHPQLVVLPHTEDSPLAHVILEPGAHGGRVPAGRGLALLRATGTWSDANLAAPDETLHKELMHAFAQICPSAESAVLFSKLYRSDCAQPRFEVGRYRAIARFDRVQRELRAEGRRLYFAGDYLTDPSLEGALASGARAAAAAAEDLASD